MANYNDFKVCYQNSQGQPVTCLLSEISEAERKTITKLVLLNQTENDNHIGDFSGALKGFDSLVSVYAPSRMNVKVDDLKKYL